MVILGLNVSTTINQHDPSACFIVDGKIAYLGEEERYTRVKHANGRFPIQAIKHGIETCGLNWSDVDMIAIPSTFHTDLPGIVKRILEMHFGSCPEILAIEHQSAHAFSGTAVSKFSDGIFLTLDGWGDNRSGSGGFFNSDKIPQELWSLSKEFSLGNFYSTFSQYLGFAGLGDEYKVMGLSAFGQSGKFSLDEFIRIEDGMIEINPKIYHSRVNNVREQRRYDKDFINRYLPPPRLPHEPISQDYRDIAKSLQETYSHALLSIVGKLVRETGRRKLVLAGGCALNCAANGRLLSEGIVDELFVQPAATDQGTALGAAIGAAIERKIEIDVDSWSIYSGSSYSEEQIRTTLDNTGVYAAQISNVSEYASDLLRRGKILGWFQGRSEFGPRALGNRSILANANNSLIQTLVNQRIKYREEFRPFAPAVASSGYKDYFDMKETSPFMTIAYKALPGTKDKIPGVIHYDNTARVQTVSPEDNPIFHDLIKSFESLTGTPVLLNTSFNIKNEPIAETPLDAIRTFFSCGLDALIMGNYVIEK